MQASSKHAALLKQAGRAGDLQVLNEQLMRNQQTLQERLKAAEERAEAAEMECKDLKDQVCILVVFPLRCITILHAFETG